jgi:hypothetical protein
MLQKDFEYVISNHPNSVEATYKGTSTMGVMDVQDNRLFDGEGASVYITGYTFTYLTNSLPAINAVNSKTITVNGKSYTIKNYIQENKFLTNLYLEER